jgi:arylsulfatase A-like enzyme
MYRLPVRSGMSGEDGGYSVLMCNAEKGLPKSEKTLPELLQTANYTTGMVVCV